MSKPRIATIWLDGCAGCHMSLLDLDENILPILAKIELVYGPLVDFKEFPEKVDLTLVEGAISSVEDLHKLKVVRERSTYVASLGDCAVTSNVPAMRNPYLRSELFQRAYVENVDFQPQIPTDGVPALLPKARPLHEFVTVDLFIPGCPPSPEVIQFALSEFLDNRIPVMAGKSKFG